MASALKALALVAIIGGIVGLAYYCSETGGTPVTVTSTVYVIGRGEEGSGGGALTIPGPAAGAVVSGKYIHQLLSSIRSSALRLDQYRMKAQQLIDTSVRRAEETVSGREVLELAAEELANYYYDFFAEYMVEAIRFSALVADLYTARSGNIHEVKLLLKGALRGTTITPEEAIEMAQYLLGDLHMDSKRLKQLVHLSREDIEWSQVHSFIYKLLEERYAALVG